VAVVSIFLKEEISVGGHVSLDKVHYLARVMRLGVGDRVRLVNGRGREFFGTIVKVTKYLVEVSHIEYGREERTGSFLGLIFPPIGKLEILIKMATELGVTNFLPFKAQYGQVRYSRDRIEKNIIEAVEQSERLDFPKLDNQQKLTTVLGEIDPLGSVILFCEERNPLNLRFPHVNSIRNKKIYAMIGPEGGFSREEIDFTRNHPSVVPVSLGKTVLRTETACASIISLINYFQSCE
jgi:16S rRNA (uracil1498-N3)-methyltransferase